MSGSGTGEDNDIRTQAPAAEVVRPRRRRAKSVKKEGEPAKKAAVTEVKAANVRTSAPASKPATRRKKAETTTTKPAARRRKAETATKKPAARRKKAETATKKPAALQKDAEPAAKKVAAPRKDAEPTAKKVAVPRKRAAAPRKDSAATTRDSAATTKETAPPNASAPRRRRRRGAAPESDKAGQTVPAAATPAPADAAASSAPAPRGTVVRRRRRAVPSETTETEPLRDRTSGPSGVAADSVPPAESRPTPPPAKSSTPPVSPPTPALNNGAAGSTSRRVVQAPTTSTGAPRDDHRPRIAPPGSAHGQTNGHRVRIAAPGSAGAQRAESKARIAPPGSTNRPAEVRTPAAAHGAAPLPRRAGLAHRPAGGKVRIAPPGSSSAKHEGGARPPATDVTREPLAPAAAVDLNARPAPRDPPRKATYRPPAKPAPRSPTGASGTTAGAAQTPANSPDAAHSHAKSADERKSGTTAAATPDHRTRRARQLIDRIGEAPVERAPTPELQGSVSVVVIGRNHAAVVEKRLTGLRNTLTAVDTGWWLLDLGSVDGTVAKAEAARVQVIRVPGGQVQPLETLDLAMAACGGEVVVFFDAACAREAVISHVVEKVRQGAPLALVDARLPGAMAVGRRAWEQRHFSGHFDLQQWAIGLGRIAVVQVSGSCLDKSPDAALLPLALDRRRRRHARKALWAISQKLQRLKPGGRAKDRKS